MIACWVSCFIVSINFSGLINSGLREEVENAKSLQTDRLQCNWMTLGLPCHMLYYNSGIEAYLWFGNLHLLSITYMYALTYCNLRKFKIDFMASQQWNPQKLFFTNIEELQ